MKTIERYLDLDKLFLSISSENPFLSFSAICFPERRTGGKTVKEKRTVHYNISYKNKRYFLEKLNFITLREKKELEKFTKGYTTKEELLQNIKSDLTSGHFKDCDSDRNYLSDLKIEENFPFEIGSDFFGSDSTKLENIKIAEYILVGFQSSGLLGFGVPILNTTAAEKRYDTVKSWSEGRDSKKFIMTVVENLPVRGIKRLGVVSRYSTSNKLIAYSDPRGFIFQVSTEDSNQLTKDLEDLGTKLEDTMCVWDCSGRSPTLYPVEKYNITRQYGMLTLEQEKKYTKERTKEQKIYSRLDDGLYQDKYIPLEIESCEMPGLLIVLDLKKKNLQYLSKSQLIELYSQDIDGKELHVTAIDDKIDELVETLKEKLIKSGKFIDSDKINKIREEFSSR